MSSEWRVDANGSVILTRVFSASTGNVDAPREGAPEIPSATAEQQSLKEPERAASAATVNHVRVTSKIEDTFSPADSGGAFQNADCPVDADAPEGERMLQKKTGGKRKTFRQVVLCPLFLTDLLWISVQRLRSWIFVGMFNPWITRLACGDKTLGKNLQVSVLVVAWITCDFIVVYSP